MSAQIPHFTSEDSFNPGKDCKVFSLSYPQHTGEELHSHSYMQIWYVKRGMCRHLVEGSEHAMVRGEAFILPPYMVHQTNLESDCEIFCCEFSLDSFLMIKQGSDFSAIKEPLLDLSFMNYFMRGQGDIKPKFSISGKNREIVEQLFKTMLNEYEKDIIYSDQFMRVYILELLLIFAREYYVLPYQKETTEIYYKYKSAVERSIDFIHEHYTEQLTLDKICKFSAVSKTYFCYLFKMLTQKTFVEYLMDYRIKQAMLLLETTDQPITKICFSVGFNDLTHFSRTFKKIVGVSARTYRALKNK